MMMGYRECGVMHGVQSNDSRPEPLLSVPPATSRLLSGVRRYHFVSGCSERARARTPWSLISYGIVVQVFRHLCAPLFAYIHMSYLYWQTRPVRASCVVSCRVCVMRLMRADVFGRYVARWCQRDVTRVYMILYMHTDMKS